MPEPGSPQNMDEIKVAQWASWAAYEFVLPLSHPLTLNFSQMASHSSDISELEDQMASYTLLDEALSRLTDPGRVKGITISLKHDPAKVMGW